MTTTVAWDKPGPGTWELDRSHVTTPGPIIRSLFSHAMGAGMAEACELFGAPIQGMEARWVHGRFYRRIVPLVGSRSRNASPSSASGAISASLTQRWAGGAIRMMRS